MIIFLVVYFLNNKIKTMSIFSRNHVKLIILKGLMSLLVHYVLQLFLFSTLSFKSFIMVLCIFEMHHFGPFLKFKI